MPKFIGIKIISKGINPSQWFAEVQQKINTELPQKIMLSAELTAEIMKTILKNSGYNLQKLSDTINVEKTTIGIGIGRINELPVGTESGASYWEAFNSGFKVTQMNIGYFGNNFRAPEPGGSGEKWRHTGKDSGFFLMKPNKVIEPLRYIDIGFEALKKNIAEQINKISKSGRYGYNIGGAR
jgi:hypothetical protein